MRDNIPVMQIDLLLLLALTSVFLPTKMDISESLKVDPIIQSERNYRTKCASVCSKCVAGKTFMSLVPRSVCVCPECMHMFISNRAACPARLCYVADAVIPTTPSGGEQAKAS